MNRIPGSVLYEGLVDAGQISPDQSQYAVLALLDQLADKLVSRKHWNGDRKGLFRRQSWERPECGLYIWGGVGRGKTFLMDLFVDSLPEKTAVRLHFHRFMNHVHDRLTALQGKENPLEIIADELAREDKVLCLDECFVSDITDAMVLGSLFDAFFRRGVSLVTTSNTEPDQLYKDGLQRDRFLPAIALIKKHCRIFNLDSGTDYRLRALENAKLYYAPCDGLAIDAIWESVLALTTEEVIREGGFIEINRRQIPVRFVTEDLVWFDFNEICGPGRAAPDYIEVAKIYHTVVVTAVPDLVIAGDDLTRRFLHLVDEFYDRSVNLILGADVSMEALYIAGRLTFEMERCRSRLLEMQSVEYLERPHRPD